MEKKWARYERSLLHVGMPAGKHLILQLLMLVPSLLSRLSEWAIFLRLTNPSFARSSARS
jgi:hypothetical protein